MELVPPTTGSGVLMAAAAFAVFAIALAYGYYFVFSRSMSLDEGYLMITVQGFNGGHALYDSVFTQYGPLYYFYEWILRGALSIPLTHDATRFLCVAHWLIAAALLGAAAWQMTRSVFAAVFVAAQAVVHLSAIAHEPGHPQEMVVVLLALGILLATRLARGRWTMESLAVIAALLAFTKINVGVFFGFAVLLAMRCHSADRLARGVWNWLLLAACAVLPFALMRQHLDGEWCRNFATAVACAVFSALLVAQRATGERALGTKRYFTAAAAFGMASAVLLGLTLFTGTSWHGLLDGLILTPMRMPRVALLPIALTAGSLLSAWASVAMAVLVAGWGRDSRVARAVTLLKALYAVIGAFVLVGDAKPQLAYVLPWVWLVAVPSKDRPWSAADSFARVFLCLAAAWQALQAYPIAGTQVTLATLLLVLGYGVCLSDVLRGVAQRPRVQSRLAGLTPGASVLAQTFAVLALLFLFANVWSHLPQVRREHARLLPLELPGSRHVRMDEEAVTMYRALAQYLGAECDTFVSYPGINSLYLWAGKTPPTQINSTGWGQLSFAQQEKILGSLRHVARPKLVVTEALMEGWDTPYADPIRPLVRFVHDECRPVRRIGRCLIFELKPKTEVTITP